MQVILLTTRFSDTDDEIEFDDLEELTDAAEAEVDEDTHEEGLLAAAENEDHPPYVWKCPRTGGLRWSRARSKAAEAVTEDGDDAEDDD